MKAIDRRTLIPLLLFVAVIGLTLVASAASRGPISILGNADFVEENGVIAGSGTEDDPYLIAGWEIELGSDDLFGVRIENTTAHFLLRGVQVSDAMNVAGAGIRIAFAEAGRIEACTVTATNAVQIISSTGIEMAETFIYTNGIGLQVQGDVAEEFRHPIGSSNLINDRQLVYRYGLDGETISGLSAAHITIADSTNLTIADNEVANGDGIFLAFVTDSLIEGNQSYRSAPTLGGHGIHLFRSDRNTVRLNSTRNNRLAGIQLTLSSDCLIDGNEFLVNDTGLRLLASDNNEVRLNVAFANVAGIVLTGGAAGNTLIGNIVYHENTKQGIALEAATDNVVDRNGLTDCEIGVLLETGAQRNRITSNTIVSGAYGISVSGSDNDIEGNLITQQSRGILFPETFTRTTTARNTFRGNVLADNANHVYVNNDSEANVFSENVFLGEATRMVLDYGAGNRWSDGGAGNYWGDTAIEDGVVIVYPSVSRDTNPIETIDPAELPVGILGTLERETIRIDPGDGTELEVLVVRAVEGYERWAGFRGFPEDLLDGFPGVLFEFESEGDRRFTMETVLFDLDIAFFDAGGNLVGKTTMIANSEDLYAAESPAQYALELHPGQLEALGITGDARLILP